MSGVALGIAALLAASLLLWRSIGPGWLSDRMAAVLALAGVQAVVAPTGLGTWVRRGAAWVIGIGRDLIAGVDVQVAAAAAAVAVPLIVAVTGLIWVAAMLPSSGRWAGWLGDIVGVQFGKGLVWVGALVLGVFAAAAPGPWGQVLSNALTAASAAGQSIVRAVVG